MEIVISVLDWLENQLTDFQLHLNKSLLKPNYRDHPGSLGLLDWEITDCHLKDPPVYLKDDLSARVTFSRDPSATSIRAFNQPRVNLSLTNLIGESIDRLQLDRVGLTIESKLWVKAAASGNLVYEDDLTIILQRREGSHLLAMDLGTSATCMAFAKRAEQAPLQLLDLQTDLMPFHLFPSAIWLHREPTELDDKMRNVFLGDNQIYLGFGHRLIEDAITRYPEGVLPSIKRVIEAPPPLWHSLNLPAAHEQTNTSVHILREFLSALFDGMYHRNLDIWRQNIPVEEIVISVPNTIGYQYIEDLKKAVSNRINECGSENKQGRLTTHWEIPKDKVTVIREADAVAIEYISREQSKGGLGSAKLGLDRSIVVLDFGAGTTDCSVLRFKVAKNSKHNIEPSLEIRSRQGIELGGDELDKVFAMFLFDKMFEKGLIRMAAPMKKLIFDDADLPDDAVAPRLKQLGFFSSYQTLSQKIENSAALSELQNIRMRLKNFAKLLKEHIGNGFYGYPAKPLQDGTMVDFQTDNASLALLRKMYEIVENDTAEGHIAHFRETFEQQRTRFFNVTVHLDKAFPPLEIEQRWSFSMGELWTYGPLNDYFRTLTRSTVNDALDTLKNLPKDQVIAILLSGRVLAFPLIRESILYSILIHKNVGRSTFPNKDFDPEYMKAAVVRGALQSKIYGFKGSAFNAKTHSWYFLLHFDQAQDRQLATPLISGHADFDDNNQVSGQLTGVRLRRRNDAPETLIIIKTSINDPTLALDWRDHPYKVHVIFEKNIDRVGQFKADNDRTVQLFLRANGDAEVMLYPETDSMENGEQPKGDPRPYRLEPSSGTSLWNQFPL